MKKIITTALAVFGILSISSCGGTNDGKNSLINFERDTISFTRSDYSFNINLKDHVELNLEKMEGKNYEFILNIENAKGEKYTEEGIEYVDANAEEFMGVSLRYYNEDKTFSNLSDIKASFDGSNPKLGTFIVTGIGAGSMDLELILKEVGKEKEYVTTCKMEWDGLIARDLKTDTPEIKVYYGEKFKLDVHALDEDKTVTVTTESTDIQYKSDVYGLLSWGIKCKVSELSEYEFTHESFGSEGHNDEKIITIHGAGEKLDIKIIPVHTEEPSISFTKEKVSLYLDETVNLFDLLVRTPDYITGRYEIEDNTIVSHGAFAPWYEVKGLKIGTTKVNYYYEDLKCSIEVEVKDPNIYPTSLTLKDEEVNLYTTEATMYRLDSLTEVSILPLDTTFELTYSLTSTNVAEIQEQQGVQYLVLKGKGDFEVIYTCHDKETRLKVNVLGERPYDPAEKYDEVYALMEKYAKQNSSGYRIYNKTTNNKYINSVDTAHLVYDKSLNRVGIKVYHYSKTLGSNESSSYEGTLYLTPVKSSTLNMSVFALWKSGESGGAVYTVTGGNLTQVSYTGYTYGKSAIGVDAQSVYSTAKTRLDEFIKDYTRYKESGIKNII